MNSFCFCTSLQLQITHLLALLTWCKAAKQNGQGEQYSRLKAKIQSVARLYHSLCDQMLSASHATVENNSMVQPHFIPQIKKIPTLLNRYHSRTICKVYAKVRKSTQFEIFILFPSQNRLMKQNFSSTFKVGLKSGFFILSCWLVEKFFQWLKNISHPG